MVRPPILRAAGPRFDEDTEWGRAERRDRRRAAFATSLTHGLLLAAAGISAPILVERSMAPDPAYRRFEVSIPPDDEVRRMLAPEPTQPAPRLLSPTSLPTTRPLEGAQQIALSPSMPDRPVEVTTPQVGRFAAPGGLLEPDGTAGLLSIEVDAARAERPAVLPSGSTLGALVEGGGEDEAAGDAAVLLGPGLLSLDGRSANAVTLYREEAPYTERMRRFGLSGSCEVEMRVDADGLVAEATVVSGSGSAWLDQAAVEAALRWRFDPEALERRRVSRCRYRFLFDADTRSVPSPE